jgi:hypothetical protein
MKVFAAVIGAAIGAAGCVDMDFDQGVKGSGVLKNEERSVGDFSKIESKGAFDVFVKIGPRGKIKLEGDDNLLPLVSTSVEKGTLILSTQESINPKKDMKVWITVPKLDAFELKGAGDVSFEDLNQDTFDLKVKGAGDISGNGRVKTLSVQVDGAGDVEFFDVKAEEIDATIRGAGDLDVYASKRLTAKVFGVGDIRYKGRPAKITREVKGLGDISAAN